MSPNLDPSLFIRCQAQYVLGSSRKDRVIESRQTKFPSEINVSMVEDIIVIKGEASIICRYEIITYIDQLL